jgi:predicted RNA polymerase sigma factor
MATRETGTDNLEPGADDSGVPGERLRLIFTCCHPARAVEARVALTLRTLTGLSTNLTDPGRASLPSWTRAVHLLGEAAMEQCKVDTSRTPDVRVGGAASKGSPLGLWA